jgi:putative ABC transport system ATP-binding protein
VWRGGGGAPAAAPRRRADDMLAQLGLSGKGHLRPAELSGGEKQRVAVGRALIKRPELCFADEPTSALDWTHGEQVVELLWAAAHKRGATVLIVAHDARVLRYANRVFRLEDGRLTDGEPRWGGVSAPQPAQEIKNRPLPSASAFPGRPPPWSNL